jgi:hypothetical protein
MATFWEERATNSPNPANWPVGDCHSAWQARTNPATPTPTTRSSSYTMRPGSWVVGAAGGCAARTGAPPSQQEDKKKELKKEELQIRLWNEKLKIRLGEAQKMQAEASAGFAAFDDHHGWSTLSLQRETLASALKKTEKDVAGIETDLAIVRRDLHKTTHCACDTCEAAYVTAEEEFTTLGWNILRSQSPCDVHTARDASPALEAACMRIADANHNKCLCFRRSPT